MSIILGVDPGSRITGYGLIQVEKTQVSYVASGCIRMPTDDLPVRILTIYQNIGELIRQYEPRQAAIEQVFVGKSVSSALKLVRVAKEKSLAELASREAPATSSADSHCHPPPTADSAYQTATVMQRITAMNPI